MTAARAGADRAPFGGIAASIGRVPAGARVFCRDIEQAAGARHRIDPAGARFVDRRAPARIARSNTYRAAEAGGTHDRTNACRALDLAPAGPARRASGPRRSFR
ncbi:hypothetical protein F9948_22815 [Burkholderia thailandensis]|nr:hypothetical protein [Burkholderia thailandensis]MDD1487485.1 hypothetical protein [Burkholderia thailandensis]MDD1493128.1 hypothetical protein [Burkholderia thailandensis]